MDKNKKYGVFGLGLSGLATIQYLAKHDIDFIAFDDQAATIDKIKQEYPEFQLYLKPISDSSWQSIDYLILSPGIPINFPKPHPIVNLAHQVKAKVVCDMEVFYQSHPGFFIGITGTNGKSTTTSLITHILRYNNRNAIMGGNIGIPVLAIENIGDNPYFVFEVSSFQLELLDQMKFNLAVLLNITPDHLDRHGNMENYSQIKKRIFKQSDYAIVNADLALPCDISFSNTDLIPNGIAVLENILYYNNYSYPLPLNNSLLGTHNQQNIAAAFACTLKIGLTPEEIIAALPSFVGLKHRMQYLGVYNKVTFINDSKATNADSTARALASFNNIIWIAGGMAKEGGIKSLAEYFPKIKKALFIGKAQDEFAESCSDILSYDKCNNLADAFNKACQIASPGDVVLLSPACASYDQWKNFEQRGDAFIAMFKNL